MSENFCYLAVIDLECWYRRAKKKLPKEIKDMVEKWKFSSGAAIICLVAYKDGDDVQSFQ